jgi:tRNA(fMet)-specific endonuclease VapC
MPYLPDTNVWIEFLRNRDQRLVVKWRSIPRAEIFLCSIVVYELRYGAERSSRPAEQHAILDQFLAPFQSLPFDDFSARRCAQIRQLLEVHGRRIGPHDLQIASVALERNLTLVTHNTGEFLRIPGLAVEDWKVQAGR